MIGIFFEDGTAKRVPLKDFTIQGRGGKGLKVSKSGKVVDGLLIADNDTVLVTSKTSSICISANDVSVGSRASQGVIVIKGNNVLKAVRIN
jgi:DNA gyrase/topoisomerase IV subunit A